MQKLIDNVHILSQQTTTDNDLILSARQSHSTGQNVTLHAHPDAFLLQLYTDGIFVTNPIGPKKDMHKFTCFYYLLDDLPDVARSRVNSVGLHAICYTKSLDDEMNRLAVFDVLTRDINELQKDGISVPCLSSRIYFAFSNLCSDNLGANEIGGFQRNFNSGSFCRHCFVTYEQRHIPMTDISFAPRTRARHDILVHRVSTNVAGGIVQGVRAASSLKDLIGFHPVDSLPPDIMHDFAEGIKNNVYSSTTLS